MSGYLTNLLARTFRPSEAMVQPRVNALFAPPEKCSDWSSSMFAPWESETSEDTDLAKRIPAQETRLERDTAAASNPAAPQGQVVQPKAARTAAAQPPESLASHRSLADVPLAGIPHDKVANIHGKREEIQPTRAAEEREGGQRKSDNVVRSVPAHTDLDFARFFRRRAISEWDKTAEVAADSTSLSGRQEEVSTVPATHPSTQAPSAPRRSESAIQEAPHADAPLTSSIGGVVASEAVWPAASISQPPLLPNPGPPARRLEHREAVSAIPVSVSPIPEVAKPEPPMSAGARFSASKVPETANAQPRDRAGFAWPRRSLVDRDRFSPGRAERELSEPTIEVTIGRIEVRGAAVPEPPRSVSRPATGVSLDEYLRRRSGRSRE
jgi:hypothetical protein